MSEDSKTELKGGDVVHVPGWSVLARPITPRQFFGGMAMLALIRQRTKGETKVEFEFSAKMAWAMADAMLKEEQSS